MVFQLNPFILNELWPKHAVFLNYTEKGVGGSHFISENELRMELKFCIGARQRIDDGMHNY